MAKNRTSKIKDESSQDENSSAVSEAQEYLSGLDILPDIMALLNRVNNGDIEYKDIFNAGGPIRAKIAKAKAAALQLPNGNVSIEEQLKEIEHLEKVIKQKRAFLKDKEEETP